MFNLKSSTIKTVETIPYSIKISRRAKRMRLSVGCDSAVVLTLPRGFDLSLAEEFIKSKLAWIKKCLEHFRPYKNQILIKTGRREYLKHRAQALALATNKIKSWNRHYNFGFNRVGIKNQKTRWGSCSKKGNLNFNYRIIHLPEELADYLVVHELCHLKEFNHSRRFWELVSQAVPDYKILRNRLRNFSKEQLYVYPVKE